MSEVSLLNPREDAAACKAMIEAAKTRLKVLETELTHSVLERDNYLQRIGAAIAMRTSVLEMEREYQRRFET